MDGSSSSKPLNLVIFPILCKLKIVVPNTAITAKLIPGPFLVLPTFASFSNSIFFTLFHLSSFKLHVATFVGCCIFHKQRAFGNWDDDDSDTECSNSPSDDNNNNVNNSNNPDKQHSVKEQP